MNDYYSEGNPNYGSTLVSETFLFTLYKDFSSLNEIYSDNAFSDFTNSINYYIEANIANWKLNPTDTINEYSKVSFRFLGNDLLLNISHGLLTQGSSGGGRLSTALSDEANFSVVEAGKGQSLKSNRDYEATIVYADEFGRCSTAITSLENSIYIDPSKSASINKMQIEIKHKAPYWATSYRFAIKSAPLNYSESDLPKLISPVVPLKTTSGKEIEGSFDFTSEGTIYVVYNYGGYNPNYEKVLPPSYFELGIGADKSSIDIKFKNEQDNSIVKGNEISYRNSKETQWSEIIFIPSVDSTEQNHTISDLSNGSEYEVRIRTIGIDNSTSNYLIETIVL